MSSLKTKVKTFAIQGVNSLGISSKYIGCPKQMLTTKEWTEKFGRTYDAEFISLFPSERIIESPPVTLDNEIHPIYTSEYSHEALPGFVALIPNARVWGRNGTVIAPNDILLTDVSREFGAYGGVMGKAHSINKQFYLHKCQKLKGKIAVLGTAGTYNYHHWLYDTVARVYLLKKAGCFEQIERFIIDFNGKSFQKESLQVLGIPPEKIILARDDWKFHIEAETLYVPSLPSKLGRLSKWPVPFLRDTFLIKALSPGMRLYISRRKAVSRKLINEEELMKFLSSQGFTEFFPEDHSIVETAAHFANADFVVGVHGSGFANLAFLSPGSKVIDIVAPLHLDPYYWMITNRNQSRYGYIFGEGERAKGQTDLVKSKVDHDILLDLDEFKTLFYKL